MTPTKKLPPVAATLASWGACAEGAKYAQRVGWQKSWASCTRGDWMVWLLGRLHVHGHLSRRDLVRAACASARTALEHAGKYREEIATHLSVVEAWAEGKATIEAVREARTALWHIYAAARTTAYKKIAVAVRKAVPWKVVRAALVEVGR